MIIVSNPRTKRTTRSEETKERESAGHVRSSARRCARIPTQRHRDEHPRRARARTSCGGESFILGTLGARAHFRCRMCGVEHSRSR